EIIEMATDRLCLLAGTGENQGQIDFLLQQYREYFAASYLTKHPDAEPESVFSTLIKRGAYWFYVLQFYVAQAQPYQQISWLREIQDREEIIDRTIASRAILNVLPEFNFSRQKDLEFALRVIFDKTIRWTWLEQKSVIDILKVTRSGSALPYIWKWLNDLSLKDEGNLESELSLLAQIYHLKPNFSLENEFENKIQELLQEEQTKQIAMLTSLNNDLGIDVASCNLLDFELVFNKFSYLTRFLGEKNKQLDDFISCQTPEKLCELLFGFLPLKFFENRSFVKRIQSKFSVNLVELIINNYLTGNFFILDELLSKHLESDNLKEDNIYVYYVLNLINAANDITNRELEQTVRELEKNICNNYSLINLWKSYNWLGPDITAFNSIDDWHNFRQTLMELCKEDKEWFTKSIDFDSSPHLLTSLFFHPNHWPILREEELITEEDYQQLLDSSLAHLLKIPTKPIDLFDDWTMLPDRNVPLIKILNVALRVVEDYGIEYLGNAKGLDYILEASRISRIEPVTKKEIDSILSRVTNLPPIPPIWAGAFLLMCLYTPSINLDLFIDFWKKNQDIRLIPVNDFSKKNILDKTELINELLTRENKSSLPLVATIICCRVLIDEDTESKLHDRLLKEFDNYLDNDNIIATFLNTLFNLPFRIEECLIWERPDIIEKIDYGFLDELCKRFLETGNMTNQLDYEKLREHFMVFIDNRNSYPSELVLSALEVIIKIDIDKAKRSELKDEDWQRLDY
ncbi:MAG: hypothetical protein AB4063_26200, partial [Crocosphaera sp.]